MVATIYLKDGVALKSPEQPEEQMDVLTLARLYNDSGVDKIICFDLSNDDEEHEKNILAIRQINRNIEIKHLRRRQHQAAGGCEKAALRRMRGGGIKRLQTGDGEFSGGQQALWPPRNAGVLKHHGFSLQDQGFPEGKCT